MDATVMIAIFTMGGLGLIFSTLLVFADKKLRVEENPLIAKIAEILPNANCGACGFAGCHDFATKVVEVKAEPNGCPVGGKDLAFEISQILGIESKESVKKVARVLCRGDNKSAKKKSTMYIGPRECSVQAIISGGEKLCYYGCLGGGDCIAVCKFNAIFMSEDGLPMIIEENCTGCGLCAKACPRGIIEIHPIDRDVFVFCKSKDDPKRSKEVCLNACIGCGICARKSDGGIEMMDHLAIINYDKLDPSKIPFDKCSTKAIQLISNFDEKVLIEETVNSLTN